MERFILHSEFYDNKSADVVEDSFHKAILQYGKFDSGYTDYTDVSTIPKFSKAA